MQRIGEDCPQIVRTARDGADGFPLHFFRDWARNCVQAFNNGVALEARCQPCQSCPPGSTQARLTQPSQDRVLPGLTNQAPVKPRAARRRGVAATARASRPVRTAAARRGSDQPRTARRSSARRVDPGSVKKTGPGTPVFGSGGPGPFRKQVLRGHRAPSHPIRTCAAGVDRLLKGASRMGGWPTKQHSLPQVPCGLAGAIAPVLRRVCRPRAGGQSPRRALALVAPG